ncbi:hypothetical protein BCR39DRAFT_539102 [Naematelia encephala]|uniref:BZIP domain-containing protein n=1 Tax=Naematelia encephala TaxID=71784 RepID=A0A1Y2AWY0_9TREE|nr:hypothetical protein BCR39DRAFT_539102 [Naematelia encephala]
MTSTMTAVSLATPFPSKRPAASSSSQSAKRQRLSSVKPVDVEGDEDEEDADPEDLSEEAQAKRARKEARTIRNRESAQRSRNQRKQHLAYLEKRVMELEDENRRLKSGSTPLPSTPAREPSPAHSVLSLANDLGLPTELVSTSGGVNLASVAPPPQGLEVDVKPVVPSSPALTVQPLADTPSYSELLAENGILQERVRLLESLVKNAIALSNLGGSPTTPPQYTETPSNMSTVSNTSSGMVHQGSLDWDNFLKPSTTSLQSTLSPSFHPVQQSANPTPLSLASTNAQINNLTRHPAAGEASFDLSVGDAFQSQGGGFGGEGGSDSGKGQGLAFAFYDSGLASQSLSVYENTGEEMNLWGSMPEETWGGAAVGKEDSLGLEWWSMELGMGSTVTA